MSGVLQTYPEEEIHRIVEDLLNAEFHDVLPGTSVQCGEENGIRLLDHGLLETERLKTRAYFALCSAEQPAREGEYPILVFNPHPYPVTENIECEFMLADQNWEDGIESSMTLYGADGKQIPCQFIKEESNLNLDWRKRVIFEATLPPMALSRFSVYVSFEPKAEKRRTDALIFDNGRKRVEIDGATGLLRSYAIDGVEYVKDAFGLSFFDDNPDPWGMGARQRERLGENEQPFALSQKPAGVFAGLQSIGVIEDGEIYLGIEAFFEKDATRARVLYKIYKNNDFVDVDVTVFFGDVNKILKLKLPVSLEGTLIGQTAFGTETLFTDARENVAQRFVAIDGGDKCLALFNNGTYGSHFENGTLYTSLLRGVTYCAHPIMDRPLIPTDRFVKKIDQGENSFSFRLGVMKRESLERTATEFVQRPYALNVFPTKPDAAVLTNAKDVKIALADDTVSLVTMKKADGRKALLLRLLNNVPHATDTELTLQNAKLALHFGKYEVKTVRYENGTLTEEAELII